MSFFCKITCGYDFDIDEWNKAFEYCNENNIEGKERNKILEGEECSNQCFECIAIVGERRLKTKKLIKKQ